MIVPGLDKPCSSHHGIPNPSPWKAAILLKQKLVLADGGLHPQHGVPPYCHLLFFVVLLSASGSAGLDTFLAQIPVPHLLQGQWTCSAYSLNKKYDKIHKFFSCFVASWFHLKESSDGIIFFLVCFWIWFVWFFYYSHYRRSSNFWIKIMELIDISSIRKNFKKRRWGEGKKQKWNAKNYFMSPLYLSHSCSPDTQWFHWACVNEWKPNMKFTIFPREIAVVFILWTTLEVFVEKVSLY